MMNRREAAPGHDQSLPPSPSRHPLGPMLEIDQSCPPGMVRIGGACVLGAIMGIFAIAALLDPPAAGHGAHQQLGLSPCPLPIVAGIPCPTCGMTTSIVHLSKGSLLSAMHTQPAGFLVGMALLVVAILAAEAVAAGRFRKINWYRIRPHRAAVSVILIVLAAWLYKLATMRPLG